MLKPYIKKPEFNKQRALSWSSYSTFKYSKEGWYKKYVLSQPQRETAEMRFGKILGERLASDPSYLPQVPRLSIFEHEFKCASGKIPLIGFADSFCEITQRKMKEYKTGVTPWTQKRADSHGQIDFYCFMHYIMTGIRPEELEIELVWIPTQKVRTGHFGITIELVEPCMPRIFKTKRTMSQVIRFAKTIVETWDEMERYAKNHR